MKINRPYSVMAIVSALGTIAAAMSGCASDPIPALCDQMCECNGGCSESTRDDCLNGGETLRDKAKDAGCEDTWNKYVECLEENLTCGPKGPDPGSCISYTEEIETCTTAAKDSCEENRDAIIGRHEECGLAAPDLPEDCSEAAEKELQCKVECHAEPSCDVLTGEDAEGKAAFDDCYAACGAG